MKTLQTPHTEWICCEIDNGPLSVGSREALNTVVLSGYKDWLSDVDLKAGSVMNVTAALEK